MSVKSVFACWIGRLIDADKKAVKLAHRTKEAKLADGGYGLAGGHKHRCDYWLSTVYSTMTSEVIGEQVCKQVTNQVIA